jgi:hypothetical protein
MSQHRHDSMQFTQNQNNEMSADDPGDGGRNSSVIGRAGKKTPVERSPEEQDQSDIEAFGEEGAGIAPKE